MKNKRPIDPKPDAKSEPQVRCIRLVIPRVACHHCNGSGKLPLSAEMWDTLQTVRRLQETDAAEMAQALEWKGHVTAMNNRLADLMRLGFLRRTKEGKRWMYRAV